MQNYRSGFVAVIGKPNVGKSSLVNRFVGAKISITSPKPQTTRHKIHAILTGDNYQIVFLDTPGIHLPKHLLGERMVRAAENAMKEVDLILFVAEATGLTEEDMVVVEKIKNINTPVFVLINKIDKIDSQHKQRMIREMTELHLGKVFTISALTGEGLSELQELIISQLPEGPQYYPPDMLTDNPERFVVAELIREQALMQTFDEVPHAVNVRVEEMKQRKDRELIDIQATIYVERESQKGIIIGAKGVRLKEIATKARENIEALLGSQVFLQLWVKVRKNWRNSQDDLHYFGFWE